MKTRQRAKHLALGIKKHSPSKKPVVLEPELAKIAGDFNPQQCLESADTFERWAKQLRLKAAPSAMGQVVARQRWN